MDWERLLRKLDRCCEHLQHKIEHMSRLLISAFQRWEATECTGNLCSASSIASLSTCSIRLIT